MGVHFVLCIVFLSFAFFTAGVQSGEYLGCFKEECEPVLPDLWLDVQKDNTPSTCTYVCGKLGFRLAGVQNSRYCFCGNSLSSKIQEDKCNWPCPQDNRLFMCGGHFVSGVYRADLTSVQAGEYLGCFRDTGCHIMKDMWYEMRKHNSPSTCTRVCGKLGFKLAAVQHSTHCFCGNSLSPPKIQEDECGLPCPQDSSLKCGGLSAIGIYRTDRTGTDRTDDQTTSTVLRTNLSPQESVCRVFMNLKSLNMVLINGSCQYQCIDNKTNNTGVTIFKKDGEVCNNGHGICLKGDCQEADQNFSCPEGFYGVRNVCKVFCYRFENQGIPVVMSMQEGEICIDEQDYQGTCVNGKCVISL